MEKPIPKLVCNSVLECHSWGGGEGGLPNNASKLEWK